MPFAALFLICKMLPADVLEEYMKFRKTRILFFTIVALYCIGSAYLNVEDFYVNGVQGKSYLRLIIQSVGIPVLLYWGWDAWMHMKRSYSADEKGSDSG